eukprot:TRINITY_DN27350_c0_g1_i1.p1 TRINITY_DN27350_c0_g1~~TRINITY_DN27350_c0_g1_i1.p1  ORF type:complete len:385 (-),score=58.89 TRINITY_DN27350_c0_g1_i1:102-1220(-)
MSETTAPVCRHWNRQGFCLYGNQCRFAHPVCNGSGDLQQHEQQTILRPDQSIRSSADDLNHTLALSKQLSAASGGKQITRKVGSNHNHDHDSHCDSKPSSTRTRNKVRKCGRAGIFRRWLLDNFGKELLCQGSGVLEIAGGKGELSFELLNLNNILCTVVDPRKPDLEHLQGFERKLRNGFYHRTAPLLQYIDNVYTESIVMRHPRHFRLFFEDPLWSAALGSEGDGAQAFVDSFQRAMRAEWTHQGIVIDDNKEVENEQEQEEAEIQWSEVMNVFQKCSAVVGLHPDQAVEAIIDFALASDKPFAVLPCCVYSKEFPRRQLRGKPVRKYEELVEYLVAKAPDQIGVDILGFEGRNVLLYSKRHSKRQSSGC